MENNKIIGEVQISFGLPKEFDDIIWYDRDTYNLLKGQDVVYIEQIAVAPNRHSKGIGSFY